MASSFDRAFLSLKELKIQKGLWQNDFHEYDVYNHTIQYVKHMKRLTDDKDLIAAGYLHDIGKPATAKPKIEKGVWLRRKSNNKKIYSFDNHEKAGEKIVMRMKKSFFVDLGLDQKKIARLVGAHYLPMLGIKVLRKAVDYDDFLKKFSKLEKSLCISGISKEEIMLMFLADKLGQGKNVPDIEELFKIRQALLKKNSAILKTIFVMQQKAYHVKQ